MLELALHNTINNLGELKATVCDLSLVNVCVA